MLRMRSELLKMCLHVAALQNYHDLYVTGSLSQLWIGKEMDAR